MFVVAEETFLKGERSYFLEPGSGTVESLEYARKFTTEQEAKTAVGNSPYIVIPYNQAKAEEGTECL